jgi:hypothetical protein
LGQLWATFEGSFFNFLWEFFLFWKHCSNRTKKLHRKNVKVKFFFHVFFFFFRLKIWVHIIEVGNKHLFSYLWSDTPFVHSTGCTLSDQHIFSPINPKDSHWFFQIYEDLPKFC